MFNFLIYRFFGVFGFADHENDIIFWMLGSEAYLSIIPIKYSIIYVFSIYFYNCRLLLQYTTAIHINVMSPSWTRYDFAVHFCCCRQIYRHASFTSFSFTPSLLHSCIWLILIISLYLVLSILHPNNKLILFFWDLS